jgi:hypothetical protein
MSRSFQRAVVVVDQFEEVFTLCDPDPAPGRKFLSGQRPSRRAPVISTMRGFEANYRCCRTCGKLSENILR